MDYVGQCLWDIDTGLRGIGGVENDMPQYVTLSHPDEKLAKSKNMTAEEIVQHVLEGLR